MASLPVPLAMQEWDFSFDSISRQTKPGLCVSCVPLMPELNHPVCTFAEIWGKGSYRKAPGVKEAVIFASEAAHFKAFSLRYLKTESCRERLRAPF